MSALDTADTIADLPDPQGIHAVHFYLDDGHFRLMTAQFLAQARAARAPVRYELPRHLERLLLGVVAQQEAAWTELCDRHPISVLCAFPLAGHDDRRMRAMHRHHQAYFSVRGALVDPPVAWEPDRGARTLVGAAPRGDPGGLSTYS